MLAVGIVYATLSMSAQNLVRNTTYVFLAIIGILLATPILAPLMGIIYAAIIQLFAKKLFKILPGPISRTYTAVIYSMLPSVIFLWLIVILAGASMLLMINVISSQAAQGSISGLFFMLSIIGIMPLYVAVSIGINIWSIVILIISLSKQHGISMINAFVAWLTTLLLFGVIFVIAVVLGALFSLGIFSPGPTLLGTSCIAESGFLCNNPIWAASNDTFSAVIGQVVSTGTWTNAVFCLIPEGAGSPTASEMTTASGNCSAMKYDLSPGEQVPVSIPMQPRGSIPKGTVFSGYLFVNATINGQQTYFQVATVALRAR